MYRYFVNVGNCHLNVIRLLLNLERLFPIDVVLVVTLAEFLHFYEYTYNSSIIEYLASIFETGVA